MPLLRVALVVLAVVGTTGCGADPPRRVDTPEHVAGLIRAKWGSTQGSPSFTYSCRRLDDRGRLFTCVVKDQNRIVRLARFDVTCDKSRCTWVDYPAYIG
jgi:hypothetical protein